MTDECPICLNPLNEPADMPADVQMPRSGSHLQNANACCTSCGHRFHKYCIFRHMESESPNQCPTCSHPLHRKRIYPVYFNTPAPTGPNSDDINDTGSQNGVTRPDLDTGIALDSQSDEDTTISDGTVVAIPERIQGSKNDENVEARNSEEQGLADIEEDAGPPLSNDDKCSICNDLLTSTPITSDDQTMPRVGKHLKRVNACSTSCGHTFHTYCIFKYFEGKCNCLCPICSHEVYRQRIYPTYLSVSSNIAKKRPSEQIEPNDDAKKVNTGQEEPQASTSRQSNTTSSGKDEWLSWLGKFCSWNKSK